MSSSIIGFDRFVLVRSFAFVRRSSSIQKSLFFYLKLSFGCGRFYRCMYLYAFRTSNACKMYRSQDKARKEEYEEETSAKTNLNRLEPLYVLLCVRIFRRFSISFICLGSACHSILDLRESKLYQRTMKQPFDKMSNMEENIVIFLFVLHVVSNILLFHFVSFFIWTIWKAAWAWHMQIYLRLWFIYKYMYIKRVVCCSLVRIRIFHVENLSLDVVFLRFDSIAREMMISCFIPCLVSLFIDSICFFRTNRSLIWLSFDVKIWFWSLTKKTGLGQCSRRKSETSRERERWIKRLLRVVHVQVVGIRRSSPKMINLMKHDMWIIFHLTMKRMQETERTQRNHHQFEM